MRGDEAMTSALWRSLGALVPVLPPPGVVPALQCALRDLLAEEPTPRPLKKNRPRWTGDIATWAPLRARVLATLGARGMTRRELAETLEISFPTLKPSLLPTGPAPSKANIARLQGWLEAIEGTEVRVDDQSDAAMEATAGRNR